MGAREQHVQEYPIPMESWRNIEEVSGDRELVGLAKSHDIGHGCTEVSLVHRVVVGGVGTSRSGGCGAAVPDADPDTERLDTSFQIIDICRIELKAYNLVGQCRHDDRCRDGNPQLRSGIELAWDWSLIRSSFWVRPQQRANIYRAQAQRQ
jgi:hypothetical protein